MRRKTPIQRCGPGPVFAYEWKALTRRWQPYALRSAFVSTVLVSLAVAWWSFGSGRPTAADDQLGRLGEAFYKGIVLAMLVLTLAIGPAVTCGAIGRDKARGHLELLLVSDLSDAEIVLGKLAAWLAPGIGLVIGVMPVAAIASVLGGIDPGAMTGSVLVAIALAVLGSTLGMTLSVWATKPGEVLLAVYAVWVLWLLSAPTWSVFSWIWGIPQPPLWVLALNPFDLCLLPYAQPGKVGLGHYAGFVGGGMVISAVLAAVAVSRVRAVAVRQMGGDRGGSRRRREWRWWPGPSLDRDPIAWRERRRSRPSPWGIALVWLYAMVAFGFSLLAIIDSGRPNSPTFGVLASYVNAFQVAFGLPLLGLWAAASLAEDRDTGMLTILLTTPRTTREIVRAKWWAVGRLIPRFLVLPAAVLASVARWTDQWAGMGLVLILLLAQAAAMVSLGLVIATWVRRFPLALGAYVGIVAGVSIGLGITAQVCFPWFEAMQFSTVSPFYAAYYGTERLVYSNLGWSPEIMIAQALWAVFYLILAALLLLATRCSFDRRLGRSSGRRHAGNAPKSRDKPAFIRFRR